MSSPHRLYRTNRMVSLTLRMPSCPSMGLTLRPTYLAPLDYEHLGDYEVLDALHRSSWVSGVGLRPRPAISTMFRRCCPIGRYDNLSSIPGRPVTSYLGWRAPLPNRKSTNPPANSSGGVTLPTCTSCSENAARSALLWPVERRATVVATVMGERPAWPPAACRNNIEVICAPTDDR